MSDVEQALTELTEAIWSTHLGLEITAVSDAGASARTHADFVARIGMSIAPELSIELRCSEEMARLAAACMFTMDEAAASLDDQREAIGELINMIAGNVRGLVAPEGCLTLPTVLQSDETDGPEAPSHIVNAVDFECRGMPFRVVVTEGEVGP